MSTIQKVESVQGAENITTQKKKIVFQIGGPIFHPVAQQAGCVANWIGPGFVYELRHGIDVFEDLDKCDLLVLMGLDCTFNGDGRVYRPMTSEHKNAFEKYIASGRPLLVQHGGTGSYDDCPIYEKYRGFTWVFNESGHTPENYNLIKILPTNHPVIAGVEDFYIYDELYYKIKVTEGLPVIVHAQVTWFGQTFPMVMTAEGGRVKGAGKVVYFANGHNMPAFECPSMKKLWMNAVNWLLEKG